MTLFPIVLLPKLLEVKFTFYFTFCKLMPISVSGFYTRVL